MLLAWIHSRVCIFDYRLETCWSMMQLLPGRVTAMIIGVLRPALCAVIARCYGTATSNLKTKAPTNLPLHHAITPSSSASFIMCVA